MCSSDLSFRRRRCFCAHKAPCTWEITQPDLDVCPVVNDHAVEQLGIEHRVLCCAVEQGCHFCLQRPDVLSRDDLAIQRGLRMLYGRRSFSDREFQRIRRRYSPYGTVASLYLWAVAAGALPELRDPAPPRRKAAAQPPLSQKDRK